MPLRASPGRVRLENPSLPLLEPKLLTPETSGLGPQGRWN